MKIEQLKLKKKEYEKEIWECHSDYIKNELGLGKKKFFFSPIDYINFEDNADLHFMVGYWRAIDELINDNTNN